MKTNEYLDRTVEVASLAVCDWRIAGWPKAISYSGYDILNCILFSLRDWSSYYRYTLDIHALSLGLPVGSSTARRSQSFTYLQTIEHLCTSCTIVQ
jgi:hypothetical protein